MNACQRVCSDPDCDSPAGLPGSARGFCRKHYKLWRKTAGDLRPLPLEVRFRQQVDMSSVDGCWPWTGRVDKAGYGRCPGWGSNGSGLAHRLAWTLAYGPIPKGLHVLHRCDNPPCCNPADLFLGTDADNTADKMAKGRHRSSFTIGARGEQHPRAKLTQRQVDEIRQAFASGGVSKAELGRRYGMSRSTIYVIVTRRNWA